LSLSVLSGCKITATLFTVQLSGRKSLNFISKLLSSKPHSFAGPQKYNQQLHPCKTFEKYFQFLFPEERWSHFKFPVGRFSAAGTRHFPFAGCKDTSGQLTRARDNPLSFHLFLRFAGSIVLA